MQAINLHQKPNHYLTWILAGFIFLLFFLSAFSTVSPQFFLLNQAILWGGGPVLAIITISHFTKRPFALPPEMLLYFFLLIWSLSGLLVVIDMSKYFRYFRLMFSISILWFSIAVVIYRTGNIRFCIISLWLTCLLYVGYSFLGGEVAQMAYWQRIEGLAGNANGFANIARIGILAGLFLMTKESGKILKLTILGSIALFIYGIFLSASRGNFLNLGVIILLFLIFKYIHKKGGIFIVLGIILGFIYGAYYVITEYLLTSNVINRFLNLDPERLADSEPRIELYIKGWKMFLSNPLFGVGMNQFTFYSGKHGAHSDWMDLLATRGIVGFILYLMIYILLWRRFSRLKKRFKNTYIHHQMIIFQLTLISQLLVSFTYENHLAINDMTIIAILTGYSWYLEKSALAKQTVLSKV